MAIHDTEETSTAPAPASSNMNFASQPQKQPEQKMNNQFSFHSSNIINAPISENPGDDVLMALDTSLSKALEATSEGMEFKTVRLDRGTKNDEYELVYSMLVVVGFFKGDRKFAGYHTLILEATGDTLKPRMHNIGGEQVEELVTPSAAYDDVAIKMIETTIKTTFPGVQLFSADSQVVPSSFNPVVLDKDEAARIRIQRLAHNVALAVATELSTRLPAFTDLNMRTWARDSQLVVTPRFERGTFKGVDELPRRQDIRIEMSSQQNRQSNQQQVSVNNGDRTVKISELSAFVDLLYAPMVQQAGYMQQVPGAPKQQYAANIIVTNLWSGKIPTIGGTLLAIAGARSITENNNWYAAFRPTGASNMMTDIGYLNLEANIENSPSGVGQYFNTSLDSFTTQDLVKYLNHIIRPGAVVSVDVPESGPESWLLSVFSVASTNHAYSENARKAIYHSAQTLTGGTFGQFFTEQDQMFDNMGNRVHMGHFRGQDGEMHDLREVDYISIAAMSKDAEQIKAWSDTFTALQLPPVLRLARRKRMITALLGADNVRFTGYANRVTFSQKFLTSLTAALAAAGVVPRLDSNALGMAPAERGAASWVDSALVNPAGTSFFNSGMGMLGSTNSYAPYYNRSAF